jgi:hypothetical protein
MRPVTKLMLICFAIGMLSACQGMDSTTAATDDPAGSANAGTGSVTTGGVTRPEAKSAGAGMDK